MSPDDPWDAFRKRGLGPDFPAEFFAEFEKEFSRMQGMISKIMEDAMKHAAGPQREQPFVYGFSLRIGKDGVPSLTPFGSSAQGVPGMPTVETGAGASVDELIREPLSDVIEGDMEVSVTVELPGVEKGDVSLKVANDTVTVRVEKGARRYHKQVKLPCKVMPESAKATFKNGILDVILQRASPADAGHNVAID